MFFNKKEPKIKALEITDENFESLVMQSDKPVLLDFWASWCGPCKVLGPIIDELAAENEGKIVIGKINVDQSTLGTKFGVRSIPTIMAIQNGKIIARQAGVIPKPNLQEFIDKMVEPKLVT